ncbi:hypothetical protein MAM1_0478c10681 [Mucor ambiguus]|uniref:Nitrogen regulatory protein areA GATA-like domain-containing protein n=1 Tax=Mucor ambiguus TaxID=91626 RepID=A0A0C9MUL0_9FUNG|nr:hypothetical protein MAM1_0478c10681 [Mucor ambiguus]
MAQQSQQHSFLSVSCSNLDFSENQLATMWGAFTKCKPYIENGTRLENMSWRLWQYQRQPTNYIDNTTIKRFITSVLLSPVNVHDAYSHEVAQPAQKCYTPTTTTTMAPAELKSATSSFIVVDEKVKTDDMQAKEQQDEQHDDAYEDDEYEDDEDYYLSDDLYDDEDDDLYDDDQEDDHVDDVKASQIKEESQFNHDFKKMQPRPTTPRRSLLSDLLGRVSSPPSLLSNSTCSFTTNNSLTEDESSSASSSSSASTSSSTTTNNTANATKYNTSHTSKIALNTQHQPFTTNTAHDLSEIRWRESFHGW